MSFDHAAGLDPQAGGDLSATSDDGAADVLQLDRVYPLRARQ